jgi:hypothetical protein
VTHQRVMRTTIAASISVSRPCGAKRLSDMRLDGALLVNIRVRIITGSITRSSHTMRIDQ